MRLIDRDALEEAVQGAINIMESHGISMISASVPLAIIKGTPTVDAIPVEWLENQADNAKNLVVQAVIDYLLTLWRNGRGA